MGRREVEEEIIRPMRRAYLAPRHLRFHNPDDPDAVDEALEQYYEALAGYERATLKRAWAKVRAEHEFSIWPTPATLVQAAELYQPRPRPPTEVEEKRQRAWQSAETYANQFMKRRQLAKLAHREGWAGALRGYVQATAWVQAQLIEGLEREGISLPAELMQAGSYPSSREAMTAFQKRFAKQIASGEINVRVPTGFADRWKQEAGRSSRGPLQPQLEAILDGLQNDGPDERGLG